MDTLYFVLSHYFFLAILASISYILGKGVLKKITPLNTSGAIFLYTAFGIGMIILILFILAALQIFSLFYIALVMTPITLFFLMKIGLKELKHEFAKFYIHFKHLYKENWTWLFPLSLLIGIAIILLPLSPPQAWDETAYHLAYAKNYVEHQGLSVNPFLRYPLNAHNYILLYSLSLMAYDDVLAHIFHAFAGLLTALGIYSLGSLLGTRKIGAIAFILFISTPVVHGLMKTAFIDLGLCLFVFLSLYSIVCWDKTKEPLYLWVAGISIGLAIGTKYSGLFYLFITAVFLITYTPKIKHLFYFLGISLLVGSPWYIRNLFIAGNPISPFASEFLGYWIWDKEDLMGQKNELSGYGLEKNILNFVLLPWYLIVEPDRFREHISPLLLLCFPLLPLFFYFERQKRNLLIYLLIAIIAWFLSSQLVRYLLPIIPIMSILSAFVIVYLFHLFSSKIKISRPHVFRKIKLNKTIYSLCVTAFIFILLIFAMQKKPIPVNAEMRENYLSQKLAYYDLFQAIKKYPEMRSYQLGFEEGFYYANGLMMGDWFGTARYRDTLKYSHDIEALRAHFENLNVHFLLVNKQREPFKQFYIDTQTVLKEYRVFENQHGIIYQLSL